MNITKFGHCCLLIKEGSALILTDPGNYNDVPEISDLDAILLTHEHGDHVHIESIKRLRALNPDVVIITHDGVGKILTKEDIPHVLIKDMETIFVKEVSITSYGTEHAHICEGILTPRNTGFMINKKLFYPGDSFHNPGVKIEILALPVSGPWMRIEDAVEYAKQINPKVVFPVHDGMLKQDHRLGPTRNVPRAILTPLGVEYRDMVEGSVETF